MSNIDMNYGIEDILYEVLTRIVNEESHMSICRWLRREYGLGLPLASSCIQDIIEQAGGLDEDLPTHVQ